MKITNAKVYINGGLVDGGIEFEEKIIRVGASVTGENSLDAKGCMIIPGLIDIHTHGAMGEDSSDGNTEGLLTMSKYYAAEGVTSWCPTTMTLKEAELVKAMHAIRDFQRPIDGAKVAGSNLEGPFLSKAQKGAQNEANLHAPDIEMLKHLMIESGNLVKMISVAPEEPGAMKFIEEAAKMLTVSVGHTAATYEQAKMAFEKGASHVTHLYNGMLPIHHRSPGVVPAADEAGVTAELIVDGYHVHPAIVRMTFQLFGRRTVLISDSLRCAGMPDGEYKLGGQSFTLKNKKATLIGTNTLAGSSIHLMEGVRRAVKFGVALEDAIYAATQAPAMVIGKGDEIGSLAEGKCADFVLLDENLNVRAVYIDGKKTDYI